MSEVIQALRDEHQLLRPEIEKLLLVADGIGELSRDRLLELNRQVYENLKAEKHLAIVEGATHLFAERGTLRQVARLAANWFTRRLGNKTDR